MISRDTPLAEITLRRYEKPGRIKERELIRKVCLSLGMLQPGDSRDVIVDVLHVLVRARRQKAKLEIGDIEKRVIQNRKQHKQSMRGIASSNISRQVRRLKEMFLIEKTAHYYRMTEWESPERIFTEQIERYYLQSIVTRVKEYLRLVK